MVCNVPVTACLSWTTHHKATFSDPSQSPVLLFSLALLIALAHSSMSLSTFPFADTLLASAVWPSAVPVYYAVT